MCALGLLRIGLVIAHSQGTIIVANVLRAVAKALRSDLVRQTKPKWHPFTNRLMGGVETETDKSVRDDLAHSLSAFSTGGLDKAFKRLEKLEIYTFANCADRMRYVHRSKPVPYMEHFANECDLVARLGILSPFRGDQGGQMKIGGSMLVQTGAWGRLLKLSLHRGDAKPLIEIDGPMFVQRGAWGHLLNEHYLSHRFKPAVAAIKRTIHEGGSLPLDEGLLVEHAQFMAMIGTEAAQRAMQAYQQRFEEIGTVPAYDSASRQQLDDGEFIDFNAPRS